MDGKNFERSKKMQKSMIEKIHETMKELHFPCEWRIEWFKQKHMIEIVIMIPVSAKDNEEKIKDRYGIVNEKVDFIFEDTILLYDIHLAEIKDDNYITAIEFDEPDGLYGGTIQAICKNLRITVGEAMVQLKEFFSEENRMRFEIEWNDENYQSTIRTLKNSGRFDENIYTYPSDITEDLEENHGLE